MPTNVNAPNASAVRAATKKSSTMTKLAQAAALTALLVPLGSVAMEAAPITCGFTGSSGSFEEFSEGSGCSPGLGASNTFTWFDGVNEIYRFELTFIGLDPFAAIVVTLDDRPMTSGQFAGRAVNFPGYTPIPVVDPNGPLAASGAYRDFYVSDDSGAPLVTQWASYTFLIHWTYDSENNGYPGGGGAARVLHDIGSPSNPNYLANGNIYDEDMCIEYGCDYDPEPGNKSGDTDFQSFTNALAPVPEPSTLVLLGTGLTGFLVRRRRTRA